MTKTEAAALLHISDSTLTRRLKAGRYTCTRTGTGKWDKISFTYADLGLTPPTPEPTPDVHIDVQPEPVPEPEPTPEPRPILSDLEQKEARDAQFAADYLSGRATDSCGNTIDQKTTSLLGPRDPDESGPVESQSHMNQSLLGTNDSAGNPVDAPRHAFECGNGSTRQGSPLCAGLSQESYDSMMRDWTRRGNRRSEGEQEIASRRAISTINRSFPSSPHSRKATVR